jgi:hypothetical protein
MMPLPFEPLVVVVVVPAYQQQQQQQRPHAVSQLHAELVAPVTLPRAAPMVFEALAMMPLLPYESLEVVVVPAAMAAAATQQQTHVCVNCAGQEHSLCASLD